MAARRRLKLGEKGLSLFSSERHRPDRSDGWVEGAERSVDPGRARDAQGPHVFRSCGA